MMKEITGGWWRRLKERGIGADVEEISRMSAVRSLKLQKD